MSSTEFVEALTASATDEVILVLVKLEHPDWAAPFYIVNNKVSITSNGDIYEPTAFNFIPPSDNSSGQAATTLVIDDVSRQLTAAARDVITPGTATITVVRALTPDIPELDPWVFEFTQVDVSGAEITMNLRKETILNNNLTGFYISSDYFPGLFL